MQNLRHGPDHLIQQRLLTHLAVDFQRQVQCLQRTHFAGMHQLADRRGVVEALGDVPRQALGLGGCLQIAAGQVQAHAVAVDQRLCLLHRQLAGRRIAAQCHHQLHFVVQFLGAGRVRNVVAVADHDRIGGLHEKGRLATLGLGDGRSGAHLARVIGKVAADTVDAVHRKVAATNHRNARNIGGGNHIVGHARILGERGT